MTTTDWIPIKYAVPSLPGVTIENRSKKSNDGSWAIYDKVGNVWTRDYEWVWEPSPSSRTTEFLAKSRWKWDELADAVEKIDKDDL